MTISPITQPPENPTALRVQLGVLLGIAAISFFIGWVDGITGLVDTAHSISAGQNPIMVTSRWYISVTLPLISLVALVLAGIGWYRSQLFEVKAMIVSGAVTITVLIAVSIIAMLAFESWIETQGYERCPSLDDIQGVNRHGVENIDAAAWTPVGQCE